jgi:hypothetical protein
MIFISQAMKLHVFRKKRKYGTLFKASAALMPGRIFRAP